MRWDRVQVAVNALGTFAGPYPRETARALLCMWAHAQDLTAAEWSAVLERFAE